MNGKMWTQLAQLIEEDAVRNPPKPVEKPAPKFKQPPQSWGIRWDMPTYDLPWHDLPRDEYTP